MLGTRIALMEAGQLVITLTPEEFVRSSNPLVTAYVDAFKTDVLPTPKTKANDEQPASVMGVPL